MSPGAGAIVMGTEIVSVALHLTGAETLSRALLALGALVWLILVVRAAFEVRALHAVARDPRALTAVAGTAVLGTRIAQLGWIGLAIALLILAAAICALLIVPVLRAIDGRVGGEAYLLVVAPASVAVLACVIADLERLAWLTWVALALATACVCVYPLVLARFDLRNLSNGHGEQWIAGGSLAISALALAQLARTTARLELVSAAWIRDAALIVWIGAMLWLPALVLGELRHPRLGYDLRRWSMVFPLGMYAVCSFTLASVRNAPGVADFARVWTWVALAGWLVVAAGGISSRRARSRSGSLDDHHRPSARAAPKGDRPRAIRPRV